MKVKINGKIYNTEIHYNCILQGNTWKDGIYIIDDEDDIPFGILECIEYQINTGNKKDIFDDYNKSEKVWRFEVIGSQN